MKMLTKEQEEFEFLANRREKPLLRYKMKGLGNDKTN